MNKTIHNLGRVLLGLFVLWQVAFLAASLALKVEAAWREQVAAGNPSLKQHFPNALTGADPVHDKLALFDRKGLQRYAQATAQMQQWKLFAPSVADDFSFAEVEVRWDGDRLPGGVVETAGREPLQLPGLNEPDDVNVFVRYQNFRMRRYEMHLAPSPPGREGVFNPRTEAWRQRIADAVWYDGDSMAAYLRWRWHDYRQRPGAADLPPPAQVILYVRGYGIPKPPGPSPWRFEEYGRHPVARWLPGKTEPGVKALERYNPLTDSYESVP